jgi:DNA-binding transcriptional regulator YhcF (GntR family)
MTRFLEEAVAMAQALPSHLSALHKLKSVVRWAVTIHLTGTMPSLPSTRSSIQQTLLSHEPYVRQLETLTEQLAQRFADRNRQHWLAPGTRLPSVRECARTQGVSAYTVVAAYEQLQAQANDLIAAKQQLELVLAAAKSSLAAQEQVVANILERFGATALSPDAAAKGPIEGAEKWVKRNEKKSTC